MKWRKAATLLMLGLVLTATLVGAVRAEDWKQTTQTDFESGTGAGVDTFSDPGNVTLAHTWKKAPANPIMTSGSPGSWDSLWVSDPALLYDGTTYRMWFTGSDGTDPQIGSATSSDGISWMEHPGNPVLNVGAPGSWDEGGTSQPTVLFDGAIYHMWFTGFGASEVAIGYATSPDGLAWTEDPGNPVLTVGAPLEWDDTEVTQPFVLFNGAGFEMWYTGNDGTLSRIGYAASPDGIAWTKYAGNPVLDVGLPGEWDDEDVFNPVVLNESGNYRMWYSADDGTSVMRAGLAESTDGITWTRHTGNPAMDLGATGSWDDYRVSPGTVLKEGRTHRMWFAGSRTTSDYKIGHAESPMGSGWTKYGGNPVLDLGAPGSWDDERVSGPTVIYDGSGYGMWYAGYDGLNTRIGYATSPDGILWTKDPGNPVLDLGLPGSWDELGVSTPCVLFDGAAYMMWFSGYDGTNTRVGYATSPDGIVWTKFAGNPVLDVGPSGSWDDSSVHQPSVLYDGATYRMWFTGNDGATDRIGYATSPDGTTWTEFAGNPVLSQGPSPWEDSNVGSPSVLYDGAAYRMWFRGRGTNHRIGLATSPDCISWARFGDNPVLDLGAPASWDDSEVFEPEVMYNGSTYLMWFSGSDGVNDRIGFAVASEGSSWARLAANPVIDLGPPGSWDGLVTTGPAVLRDGVLYKMWYAGYDGTNYRIGYATSFDGAVWTKYSGNPVMDVGLPGSWDSTGLAYPSVLYDGSTFMMWYSGGSGGPTTRIGLATSPDGIAWTRFAGNVCSGTSGDGCVLDLGAPGSWDEFSVGIPSVIYDGTTYLMWYSGYDGSAWRIGHATSPDGSTWTKFGGNPVMDVGSPGSWEDVCVADPGVIYDGALYRMWYAGYDGSAWRIGFAVSSDGIAWSRSAANPRLNLGLSGSWDDSAVEDPAVLQNGQDFRMWYIGYDGSTTRVGTAAVEYPSPGNLSSGVFDSGAAGTTWNFVNWTESLPPGANITLSTRSGDVLVPDASWSPWSAEMWDETGSAITSPRSRYIQYRALLATAYPNATPILSDVNVNYSLNTAQPPTPTSPANDVWTSDNLPGFAWTFADLEGDSQSNLTVEIDDDPLFGSIDYSSGDLASAGASWTPGAPLADGTWYWHARTRDSYGLWSANSSDWIVKIDTAPPSVSSLSAIPDPQEVNGYVNISVSVSDLMSGLNGVWVNIPGVGNFSMGYDAVSGKYYHNATYGIPNAYSYTVWTGDNLDNWNSTSGLFAVVDTTSPLIASLVEIPDPQEVGGAVNVSAAITDNYLMGGAWVNIAGVGNFSMAFDAVSGKYYHEMQYNVIGTYAYTIWADDTSGNWASQTGSFLVRDTTLPVIGSVTENPDPQEAGGAVNVSAVITDNYLMGGAWVNIAGVGNFSMAFDAVSGKYHCARQYNAIGTYTYTIWANDTSGNWASYSGSFLVQDKVAPSMGVPSDDPDPQEVFGFVNVSVSVTDVSGVWGVWINIIGVGNLSMTLDPLSGLYYRNDSYSVIGIYAYVIWANDSLGNWASALGAFSVRDTTPPSIAALSALPSPQEVGGSVNVSALVTDGYLLSGVWVEITDPDSITLGNFSMYYDAGLGRYYHELVCDKLGTYDYSVRANDSSDNWASVPGSFDVLDMTPPSIIGAFDSPDPQLIGGYVNITADAADNFMMATVWVDIQGVGNFSMGYDAQSGLFFHEAAYPVAGTYAFTVWASDTSDNWDSTGGSFVIVPDTSPPTVSNLQESPDPVEVNGTINITATVTDNLAMGTVGINIPGVGNFSMDYDPTTGLYYYESKGPSIGTYTYTIWASDASGNWDSASSSFTVNDTTSPVSNAGGDRTAREGTAVTFNGSGSTDNDAIDNYTWVVMDSSGRTLATLFGIGPSYTFPSAGTYTVKLTVRDREGNVDDDVMTVAVTDGGGPGTRPGGTDLLRDYWWLLLVIAIIALMLIVFFLLSRRKGPAEGAALKAGDVSEEIEEEGAAKEALDEDAELVAEDEELDPDEYELEEFTGWPKDEGLG